MIIFRAVVEGGSETISKMESFHLFFEAPIGTPHKRLEEILTALFGKQREHYDAYNVFSDGDLHRQSEDALAFLECHLIENGFVDGKPAYLSPRDSVVFLAHESRRKIMDAFDIARLFPGTVLQEQSLERIEAIARFKAESGGSHG